MDAAGPWFAGLGYKHLPINAKGWGWQSQTGPQHLLTESSPGAESVPQVGELLEIPLQSQASIGESCEWGQVCLETSKIAIPNDVHER